MKKITCLLGGTGWLLALPVAAQETNRPVLLVAFRSDPGAGTRPPRQEFGMGFGNGLATYDIGGKTPHTACNLQYRYRHNSGGGLSTPNQGINDNIVYAGVSWFF